MQTGKLNKKTVKDEKGEWEYEFYGTWKHAEIKSVRKVEEFFFTVDNPEISE